MTRSFVDKSPGADYLWKQMGWDPYSAGAMKNDPWPDRQGPEGGHHHSGASEADAGASGPRQLLQVHQQPHEHCVPAEHGPCLGRGEEEGRRFAAERDFPVADVRQYQGHAREAEPSCPRRAGVPQGRLILGQL